MTDPKPPVPVATWRSTSPICADCGHVHLSFMLDSGAVLRLAIPRASMDAIVETYAEYSAIQNKRALCHPCAVHADKSSGNPIADVSILPSVDNV